MVDLSKTNGIEIDGSFFDGKDLINLLRLQSQLIKIENIFFDLEECANIWQTYSSDLSASWLFFPDEDKDILKQIKSSNYFTTFETYSK